MRCALRRLASCWASWALDCAKAAFEEDLKGSLSPGKLADVVVLSKDILKVPEAEILEARVELTIVGGHIGYPWTDEMIALATKYPNVYIDTSAYKPSRYPEALVRFMKGRGRRKVLFGTNHPMIPPADCVAGVDALGLDDEARRLFLHDNAVRVFGLDEVTEAT